MGIREALLAATSTPTEVVQLPELGKDDTGKDMAVSVRGMTGSERDAFESSCFEGKGKHRAFNSKNLRARMVAYCCLDENGHRAFTDADAVALGNVRADLIDRLFAVAQKLSGMRDEDVDELGLSLPKTVASSSPSSASV